MNLIYNYIGRLIYIATYPFIYFSVNGSSRTRVLLITDNKILILRDWVGSGEWSLPGGGMHKSEDPKVCAVREVKEETGINLDINLLTHIETINYNKKRSTSTRYIYSVHLNSRPDLTLQKYEIIEAGWFSPSELKNMKLADDVKLILSSHDKLLKT
ncbi:MAG TPA: NUDIX hydrolase [Candidatus Saccharimonadales bacterium]